MDDIKVLKLSQKTLDMIERSQPKKVESEGLFVPFTTPLESISVQVVSEEEERVFFNSIPEYRHNQKLFLKFLGTPEKYLNNNK